ncbi:MAG: hypothetical protein ACRDZ5_12520, partial [Acidimicrobiales bacterium]
MSERLERAHLAETVAAEPVVVAQDDRHIIEVTLIRAGRSKMGNVYQPEVLREALPLFEGARAFVDHQKPDDAPERSVRDLAGSYHQVQLDESGRVRGRLHLLPDHDWLFNLLSEAAGNPDLCGLSIDAYGDVQPGPGQDRTVTALHQIASVDVVTRPSAGGQVERVLQSDRGGAAQAFA